MVLERQSRQMASGVQPLSFSLLSHQRQAANPQREDRGVGTSLRFYDVKSGQWRVVTGRVASGIAHDFNNVIGAILGWAEVGQQELPPFSGICGPGGSCV